MSIKKAVEIESSKHFDFLMFHFESKYIRQNSYGNY